MSQTVKTILFFAGCLLVTLAIYWPTRNAGYGTDFLGWMKTYQLGSFRDIPESFGYRGMHPVFHALNFTVFSVFGLKGLHWFFLYAAFHALNATLLGVFVQKLAAYFRVRWIPLLGPVAAFLFLLSPFQTETVVWKVCLHYLMTTTFALSALIAGIRFLRQGGHESVIWMHVLTLLALYSLELGIMVPILLGVLAWARPVPVTRRLALVIPGVFMIGAYFIINKIVLGSLVGHYGPETHLSFNLPSMAVTAWDYMAKHLFFGHYWPDDLQRILYHPNTLTWFWAAILLTGVLTVVVGLYRFRKLRPEWQLSLISILLFFLTLAPILNLYFYYVTPIENDRYGYFASSFLIMALTAAGYGISRKGWMIFPFVYFVFGLFFLQTNLRAWKGSAQVFNGLIKDYRWPQADSVLVLGSPDNFRGAPLFRSDRNSSAFYDALKLFRPGSEPGWMFDAAQYNMVNRNDALTASVNGQIDVGFAQYGNWFWHVGKGAGPENHELYSFEIEGLQYKVSLILPHKNLLIIYPVGNQWRELKISTLDLGPY